MNEKGFTLIEAISTLLIAAIVLVFVFGGVFVDDDVARKAVAERGFRHAEVLEKTWFLAAWRGCYGYNASFEVDAEDSGGAKMSLEVCAFWPLDMTTVHIERRE